MKNNEKQLVCDQASTCRPHAVPFAALGFHLHQRHSQLSVCTARSSGLYFAAAVPGSPWASHHSHGHLQLPFVWSGNKMLIACKHKGNCRCHTQIYTRTHQRPLVCRHLFFPLPRGHRFHMLSLPSFSETGRMRNNLSPS